MTHVTAASISLFVMFAIVVSEATVIHLASSLSQSGSCCHHCCVGIISREDAGMYACHTSPHTLL